jgi:hypothetical protein
VRVDATLGSIVVKTPRETVRNVDCFAFVWRQQLDEDAVKDFRSRIPDSHGSDNFTAHHFGGRLNRRDSIRDFYPKRQTLGP